MACCRGLRVPNTIITNANAKENLGKFICLSITKAKAKTNPQNFICNRFCVDGRSWPDLRHRLYLFGNDFRLFFDATVPRGAQQLEGVMRQHASWKAILEGSVLVEGS